MLLPVLGVISLAVVPVNADPASAAKHPPANPNIVLLMAEDITNDLGCYGKDWLDTPNVDQLARDGARYTRFYTTAPMCSASRTSLMTGVYQTTSGGMHHRSRVKDLPAEIRPVTHLLNDRGYVTVLGSDWIEPAGTKIDVNFAGWDAAFLFDYVSDLSTALEENPDKPFFQQIQLGLTHRWYSERWPGMREKLDDPVDPEDIILPPYLPDDPIVRRDEVLRLSAIEYIDQQVGVLMKAYDKAGLLDNTIFIFIGDNGQNQVRGKSYLYEPGILCPLIVKGPSPVPQSLVVDDLVSSVDLVATILQLAGAPVPEWVQGQPFLDNPDYTAAKAVITARDRHDEIPECMRAVTMERFKYIRNFMPEIPWDSRMGYYEKNRPALIRMRELHEQGKLTPEQARFFAKSKPEEELYDLYEDPHELVNLAGNAEYHVILEDMRRRLETWIEESDDKALKRNRDGEWVPVMDWKGEISKPWLNSDRGNHSEGTE